MSNTLLPVDADTIQHTYEYVLLSIRLPTGDALGTLKETLQGHVQLLAPEVRNLSPRMRGETRRTAVHILVRTSHLLKETTGSPTAQLTETYDLAVTARALLTLYLHPGPLGSPTAEGEIAQQIRQRLCGACWQPIEDDEPYERRPFDSDSAGTIHGYVHAEPCVDRPSLLAPVPPQDSSA
ncbi:DUF6415 family natural product biosynthesis protein [Streptomyces sp. NPDC001100]